MPTKIYWIHQFPNNARLGIMPRPRGADWLADEVIHLKRQQVTVLVSLLESTEIHELELQEENAECMIKDRSIPPDATGFVKNLLQKVNNGESIVIHCRMGIGRASIIAANILLLNGYTADQALANISKARGLKAPDTEEQIAWLRKQERQSYYPTQKILDTMAPIK